MGGRMLPRRGPARPAGPTVPQLFHPPACHDGFTVICQIKEERPNPIPIIPSKGDFCAFYTA